MQSHPNPPDPASLLRPDEKHVGRASFWLGQSLFARWPNDTRLWFHFKSQSIAFKVFTFLTASFGWILPQLTNDSSIAFIALHFASLPFPFPLTLSISSIFILDILLSRSPKDFGVLTLQTSYHLSLYQLCCHIPYLTHHT